MVDRQGKVDFCPFVEYIDKKDIRNAFALPRFDALSGRKTHSKRFSSDFSERALFRPEPITHQTFTSEDFESDASSVPPGESASSTNGQPLRSRITRGSLANHIPILMEGRNDSSGYSSDTKSEEIKSTMNSKASEPSVPKVLPVTRQGNRSNPEPKGSPAQRSFSNQELPRPQQPPEAHPKKSGSQPPPSPPPAVNFVQNPEPWGKRKPDPNKQIDEILSEMNTLKEVVEKFAGQTKDKSYRYLTDMLALLILKLDDVNTEGQDEVRQRRRQAVKDIRNCISLLEKRISENEALL